MPKNPHPALYEEPRNQAMRNIPLKPRESLLTWLERTGRFYSSEIHELQDYKIPDELEDILEPNAYLLDEDNDMID